MAGEKKTGLFDILYNQTDADLKESKQPLVKRGLQRKLASAKDSAEMKKLRAEQDLAATRANIDHYDINSVLSAKQDIKNADRTIAGINAEYLEMFGENL